MCVDELSYLWFSWRGHYNIFKTRRHWSARGEKPLIYTKATVLLFKCTGFEATAKAYRIRACEGRAQELTFLMNSQDDSDTVFVKLFILISSSSAFILVIWIRPTSLLRKGNKLFLPTFILNLSLHWSLYLCLHVCLKSQWLKEVLIWPHFLPKTMLYRSHLTSRMTVLKELRIIFYLH